MTELQDPYKRPYHFSHSNRLTGMISLTDRNQADIFALLAVSQRANPAVPAVLKKRR